MPAFAGMSGIFFGLLANIALNTFISMQPSVDWIGHVAGFATGLALGPFLFPASFVQKAVED